MEDEHWLSHSQKREEAPYVDRQQGHTILGLSEAPAQISYFFLLNRETKWLQTK